MTQKRPAADESEPGQKYRYKPPKNLNNIKEDVRQLREKRRKALEQQSLEEKQRYEKGREQLRRMHEQFKKDREAQGLPPTIKKGGASEVQLASRVTVASKRNSAALKNGKITQELLASLSYKDLNQNKADDFRPEDLLIEDDNSEDEILKRFRAKENRSRVPADLSRRSAAVESVGAFEARSARGHVSQILPMPED